MKDNTQTKPTREERGWPGHFILAGHCVFRRNTLLTLGDVRVVVSTVGAMKNRDKSGYDIVGHNRYFETMAFHAQWEDPYWDVDVSEEISFSSKWTIPTICRTSDLEANEMHEAVVKEIADRMVTGNLQLSFEDEEED